MIGGLSLLSAQLIIKLASAEESSPFINQQESYDVPSDSLAPNEMSPQENGVDPQASSDQSSEASPLNEQDTLMDATQNFDRTPEGHPSTEAPLTDAQKNFDESSDGLPPPKPSHQDTKNSFELTEDDVHRLMKEEEERRRQRNGRRGRMRELEETRNELAQKQLELLQKEKELLDRDQSLAVLREELELERRIRALLTKEKEQAIEEAALARGLCAGAPLLP